MQAAVLGNAGCGKTSLIRALLGLPFDPDSPPTEKRTSFRSPVIGKDSFLIDCGHIEDEDALQRMLLGSKVNCVLLTYDCGLPSSLESVMLDWLDAVLATGQRLFMVLVGLKCEFATGEISSTALEFANSRSLFSIQVSSRLGENIALLLEVLQLRVPSMVKQDHQLTPQHHRTHPTHSEAKFPLFVDVKTGLVSGTIAVHSSSDDPVMLARRFLLDHGLDLNRAGDLAKIVQNRLSEFYQASGHRLARGGILSRLTVVVNSSTMAVVVVREGDDCKRLVEAFRKTYDVPKGDPMLDELADRVQLVLENGLDADGEDLRLLLLEEDSPKPMETVAATVATNKSSKTSNSDRRRRGSREEDEDDERVLAIAERRRKRQPKVEKKEYMDQPPPLIHKVEKSPQSSSLARTRSKSQPQPEPLPSPIVSPGNRKQQSHQQQQQQPEEEEEDELSAFEEEEDLYLQPQPIQAQPLLHRPMPFSGRISGLSSTNTLKRMNQPPPPPPSRYSPTVSAHFPPPPPASRYVANASPGPRYLNSTAASRSFYSVPPQPQFPFSHPPSSRPVLFYVDVNLGGKSERIAVCKGDDLQHLAERFLDQHRLPKTKLAKLTQLLDVHLKQHQRNRRTML
ncbi:hypothetical protein BASA81_012511 [Batrachochytrium salamandrivorans]|nr:hypothetical protein BASA81_012511 [Batrachochytrium salamandrivorans]